MPHNLDRQKDEENPSQPHHHQCGNLFGCGEERLVQHRHQFSGNAGRGYRSRSPRDDPQTPFRRRFAQADHGGLNADRISVAAQF